MNSRSYEAILVSRKTSGTTEEFRIRGEVTIVTAAQCSIGEAEKH